MKRIYIISFIALLIFSVSGCKKSFLDVQPTQFLTAEQVAEAAKNNPDVIAGSMSGIYTLMFQTGTGGSNLNHDDFGQKGYDIYSDFLSSDLALSINTYNWYRALTELTVTVDYTTRGCYQPWRYYYRIIRSTNSVIGALGGNDVVPELDENKYIMGQAKAMRAYAYFYLAQFYEKTYDPEEAILPIYTDLDQFNQPKSTAADVYNQIISDLTDAISLLDGFQRSAKNEVNKYVAEGLLAYAYGAMGGNDNYAQVKTLTADIINNGGFTLMDSTEVVFTGDPTIGGFKDVNTPGWMWGVDLTLDNGLDLVSWWGQMDLWTYSYQWAGDRKAIDEGLYDKIPANDVRKGQFYANSSSGYYLLPIYKFYTADMEIGGQRNITTDYVYMRVAEMYLLNAEAAAKTGDEATARTSLKALVSHRMADASYIDALTGKALVDEIYLQTRIELFAEGKSYLAMKRNHATTIRGANHLSHVGEPISFDDPRLTFLIPQAEIQNNTNIN
ncbi:RagB/SusD family nutrient uptake outer membrane protein [Prolixibacter denitrificans]|uniref:Membrane protein n=1 Tax=Prolixibacter denitrificans TaxID=1541063 RepID=A0A2P8CBN7_9BACT|nr:RagB/SusD family nutrient uptake outer membrane protein [Prolixibacter denitrificans]PSK82389.1 SusD-like starch-binding protein associating with outer membrane [Prolixibacter denitrificans]GET22866.1 membrane protein [Prolixibacter denitrificans]